MDDYENLDVNVKFSVLSRWFLTSLAVANTPSACDSEIASTLAQDPIQAFAIAELLNYLDDKFFSQEEFLTHVQKLDYKADYRAKILNLKRLIAYLLNWYEIVMMKTFTEKFRNSSLCLPEYAKYIIEDNDNFKHRCMLLQLILGIAIQNADQVSLIMDLEPDDQAIVAASINHLTTGQIDNDQADENNFRNLNSDYENESVSSKDQYNSTVNSEDDSRVENGQERRQKSKSENQNSQLQKIHDLRNSLQTIREHKHQMEAENEQLQERLRALTNNEFFQVESEHYQQKIKALNENLNEVIEEKYRLELLKDEYAAKVSVLSNEISALQDDSKEKDLLLQDYGMIQDEVEYLKREAERAATLEAALESAKRKLLESDGLRQKIREQQLQITSFEEKLKLNKSDLARHGNEREELTILKLDHRNLLKKVNEENAKREQINFENKQLNESLKASQAENSRLKADLDNFTVKPIGEEEGPENLGNVLSDAGISLKQTNFDDDGENGKICQLESQLNLANERINELVQQLEEQVKSNEDSNEKNLCKIDDLNNKITNFESKMENLVIKNEYLVKQNTGLLTQVEDTTRASNDIQTTLEEKEALLSKKDLDVKALENRYKVYLEKARGVIRQLSDDKKKLQENQANEQELTRLKNEIASKSKIITKLENEAKRSRENRSDEEKLIVNAWHRLSQSNQFKTVQNIKPKPIDSSNKSPAKELINGESFLSKQRQNANKRFAVKPGEKEGKDGEEKGKSWIMGRWTYF